jgi:hypothetical protein
MRCCLPFLLLAGCLPSTLPGDGDRDYDGFSEAEGDCDDTDPNISPTASDIVGDGIDQNCDGVDGTDTDGDGFASSASGGEDCDDTTNLIHPDAQEEAWNDIDEDCSGRDLHDYVQISAGKNHVCGVASNGNIVCWGNPGNDVGQSENQVGNYRSVHCGTDRTCTITQGNVLSCYGAFHNSANYSAVPNGNNYLTVDLDVVNSDPACAIKVDGTLECGDCTYNASGQTSAGCNPPFGMFTQVSVTNDRGCALSIEGKITCWGAPEGNLFLENVPKEDGYSNLEVASQEGACALGATGALHCWGPTWSASGPEEETDSNELFTQLSAFSDVLCAIKEDDQSIWCYGVHDASVPTGQFTQVSIGNSYACALDTIGEARCWNLSPSEHLDMGLLDPP